MLIDNSIFSIYSKCPLMYFERYEVDNRDVQEQRNRRGLQGLSGESDGETATAPGVVSMALRRALPTPELGQSSPGHQSDFGAIQPALPGESSGASDEFGGPAGAFVIFNNGPGPGGPGHQGIELDEPSEGLDFGTRMHQLLHIRRCRELGARRGCGSGESRALPVFPEWPDEAIEAEAQATLAAYEAHYINEYEYLESERTSVLEIPPRFSQVGASHQLVVKLDAVVRHSDGTIGPFDTKTESRTGYNTREDWAGKTQAKIYLYALGLLYPDEKVSRLVVDVVTRGSAKARRGPIFNRLDDISSSPGAIEEAIRNVAWVADDIERSRKTGWWRSNMNMCKRGWERCDYYDLHVYGRTSRNLSRYRPAEQYLDL